MEKHLQSLVDVDTSAASDMTHLVLDMKRMAPGSPSAQSAPKEFQLLGSFRHLRVLSMANVNCFNLKGFPQLHHLIKLNLSDNHIANVEPLVHANLRKLKYLDLSNNKISDFKVIQVLANLPFLQHLSLEDCPISNSEGYREMMFDLLPSLLTLDGEDANGVEMDTEVEMESDGERAESSEADEDERERLTSLSPRKVSGKRPGGKIPGKGRGKGKGKSTTGKQSSAGARKTPGKLTPFISQQEDSEEELGSHDSESELEEEAEEQNTGSNSYFDSDDDDDEEEQEQEADYSEEEGEEDEEDEEEEYDEDAEEYSDEGEENDDNEEEEEDYAQSPSDGDALQSPGFDDDNYSVQILGGEPTFAGANDLMLGAGSPPPLGMYRPSASMNLGLSQRSSQQDKRKYDEADLEQSHASALEEGSPNMDFLNMNEDDVMEEYRAAGSTEKKTRR